MEQGNRQQAAPGTGQEENSEPRAQAKNGEEAPTEPIEQQLVSAGRFDDGATGVSMRVVLIVVIVGVALVACDRSPTGPTAQTPIDIRVGDLTNPKLGTPAPVPTVTGTLSGNFATSIWNGFQWVSVGSAVGTSVGLQVPVFIGTLTTLQREQRAPAGSYDRARLILQGVTATIAAGSGFAGITLTGDATIRLGGSDHHVELPITVSRFALEDDPSVRRVIVFALNSQQWLTRSAAESGQVEDQALQAAVSASTRIESRYGSRFADAGLALPSITAQPPLTRRPSVP